MKPSSTPDRKLINHTRNQKTRPGGFVLVAVLLLIALVVVLMVTTSSVSETERRAVSNSSKEELARQNALFALNLALSQLQVAAGPDQRVTATADILNTNSSTTTSPVAQPYWTGVWKSANPAWLSDSARTNAGSAWFRPEPLDTNIGSSTNILRLWSTNGTNVTWLVSGATNNTTISPLNSTTNWMTNSNNIMVMASNWGTGTNGSIVGGTWTNPTTVTVPLVNLISGTNASGISTNVGRYAYWVSDEGVKAKVSLTDTNMTNGSISSVNSWVPSLLHYFAPPATQISTVMTNYGIISGLTNDFRNNTNVSKLTSLGGLALITSGVTVFTNNNLAADLTPYSYGILSDTRFGGLRQDLTSVFESTTASGGTNFTMLQARSGSGTGNDASCVYRATNLAIPALTAFPLVIGQASQGSQAAGVTTIFDGLRWQSLYFFYNLYKSNMATSPISITPVGTLPTGIGTPQLTAPNTVLVRDPLWNETNTSGIFIMHSLAPNQIADKIQGAITGYTTNVVTTNSTTNTLYNFQIRFYPLIVLHNPYSVNLLMPNPASFSLTKALLGSSITLNCGTNPTTNASWVYQTVTGPTNNPTTNTFTNSPTNILNLYPYQTNAGTNGTASIPYSLVLNGYTATCANVTTMAPGEIRVYGLTSPVAVSSFANASVFSNLVSSGSITPDAYQSYNVTTPYWGGTTNATDSVTSLYLGTNDTASVGVGHYNTLRFYPSTNMSGWPGATSLNGNNIAWALPGILSSPPTAYAPQTAWTPINIGSFNQVFLTLGAFERFKGVNSISDPNFAWSSTNLPIFSGSSGAFNAGRTGGGASTAGTLDHYSTEVNVQLKTLYSALTDFQVSQTTNNSTTTSWGLNSVGAASVDTSTTKNNNSSIVYRDVPIAPMTSLGQFMQLDEQYFDRAYMALPIPGMSIGGSFASMDTGLGGTAIFSQNGGTTLPNLDNSYMANEALFDTYYFSTVPPPNGFNWGSGGYGAFSNSSITATSIAARSPLPNSRLVFYSKNGSNPTVANLQNESLASANLLINGAFNVNSTSVAAWKALLTSLAGQTFHTYNYLSQQPNDITPSSLPSGYPYPIPRFWSVSRSTPNDPWEGMRALSDAQVTALATEIVKQVRLRGPFLSLGDFLNRRLGRTFSQLTAMGALQSAIENTQTNGSTYDVNANLHGTGVGQSVTSGYFPISSNSLIGIPPNGISSIITNTATGIPGYLMQQDIVQAFAPVLAARSDTFIIRVYGESDKPSTNALTSSSTYSQVWGEAVVQRLPEFFDQSDPALTATTNIPAMSAGIALGDATPLINSNGVIIDTLNQTCGRRFKIVSFRWLNPNEL